MKLRYKLVPFEKAVVFQILDMDEKFRCNIYKPTTIKKSSFLSKNPAMKVSSCCSPEITKNEIYLRGNSKLADLNVSYLKFYDNNERDEYIKRCHEAIADWAQNWEGWYKKEPTKNPKDYVYEV